MTVLVDEPIWPWRGRRWAHLVSDRNLDELHDLAHRIGMPYVAFQGDHYDVHEDLRLAALERGAVATPARQIVRALRDAGLRHKSPTVPWQWQRRRSLARTTVADERDEMARTADVVRTALENDAVAQALDAGASLVGSDGEVAWGSRPGEWLVMLSTTARRPLDAGLSRVSSTTSVHRTVGERGTFVELVVTDPT